jgi:hypothetical protein
MSRLIKHRDPLVRRRRHDGVIRTRSKLIGLFKKQTVSKVTAATKNADCQPGYYQHLDQIIHAAE